MEPGHPRSKALYVVDPKYYDLREVKRQVELWIVAKNKHPWYDATAKVKVRGKQLTRSKYVSMFLAFRGSARIKKKDLETFLHFLCLKVKTEKGLCHMKIEFTLGWPPQAVYEMLTNPRNLPFFREDETGQLLVFLFFISLYDSS